jgi:hypothetical protein
VVDESEIGSANEGAASGPLFRFLAWDEASIERDFARASRHHTSARGRAIRQPPFGFTLGRRRGRALELFSKLTGNRRVPRQGRPRPRGAGRSAKGRAKSKKR